MEERKEEGDMAPLPRHLHRLLQPVQAVPTCSTLHNTAAVAQQESPEETMEESSSTNTTSPLSSTYSNLRSPDINLTLANQLAGTSVAPLQATSGQSATATQVVGCMSPSSVVSDTEDKPISGTVSDVMASEAERRGASSPKRKASEMDDTEDADTEGAPSHKQFRGEEGSASPGRAEEGAEAGAEEDSFEDEELDEVEDILEFFGHRRRREMSPRTTRLMELLPRRLARLIWENFAERQQRYAQRVEPPPPRRYFEEEMEEYTEEVALAEVHRVPESQLSGEAKFTISDRQRLLRLLVLGGTKVALKVAPNAKNRPDTDFSVVSRMIQQGSGVEVVDIVKDVSVKGRAPAQDGLLHVLITCIRCDDINTRRAAYQAVQDMCRVPTQLFRLLQELTKAAKAAGKTGWGRGLKRAISIWYNSAADNPMRLAMHVTKYWSRHGWTHRDVLRKSHIKPTTEAVGFIMRYAAMGLQEAESHYLEDGYMGLEQLEKVHKYLKAVEEVRKCEDTARVMQLIKEHGLVREHLSQAMLQKKEVWAALLPDMPIMAVVRNLAMMTKHGLFEDQSMLDLLKSKLTNVEALKGARIHPLKLLIAHRTYQQGQGTKGNLKETGPLKWRPCYPVVETLEQAFYASCSSVEVTNKRILIALDVSGEMTVPLNAVPTVNARQAATLMAMVTARSEPNCDVVAFHRHMIPLDVFKDPSRTLEQVISSACCYGSQATDCSKPMLWASKHNKEYDAFIIYTSSQTNIHKVPPYAALEAYRQKMNIPTAKLIVVAMTALEATIARPDDMHVLDVVGFDPDTPDMIREFLMGELD